MQNPYSKREVGGGSMTNEQAIEILKLYDYSTKLELSEGIRNHITDDITVDEFFTMKNLAIQALERQQWTPITKKWPDKKGRYLVTYREWSNGEYLPKYDNTYVRILRYHESIFRFPVSIDEEAEKDTNREVIAWMPLPEPYEEEEESKSMKAQ